MYLTDIIPNRHQTKQTLHDDDKFAYFILIYREQGVLLLLRDTLNIT